MTLIEQLANIVGTKYSSLEDYIVNFTEGDTSIFIKSQSGDLKVSVELRYEQGNLFFAPVKMADFQPSFEMETTLRKMAMIANLVGDIKSALLSLEAA